MKGRVGRHQITFDPNRVRGSVETTEGRRRREPVLPGMKPLPVLNPAPASPYEQVLFFPGPLPGLNELIEAAKTKRCDNRQGSAYTTMKKQYGEDLHWQLLAQKAHHVARAFLIFHWIERDDNRDPDNVAAGGRKILLDAMVQAGVLVDDSRAYVAGWEDVFPIDAEHPGVRVVIRDIGHMPAASGQEH